VGSLLAFAAISVFTLPVAAAVFVNVGSMATARSEHSATLLQNGQVLVAGGTVTGLKATAELYDRALGTWKVTTPLNTARRGHTATLLPNGKVLVAGGISNQTTFASAELYDPVSGTWTATATMNTARGDHTATLLPNGKVLVAGGGNSTGIVSTAELYDPASGMWTTTGSLNTGRAVHTATLLPNGQVLVAGGADYSGNAYSSAELYNPISGKWTLTNSLSTARLRHTASLLPGGKVLVAGGYYSSGGITSIATCELYDLAAGTWTTTGPLNTARYGATATLLPSGQVLTAGGTSDEINPLASAEVYEPIAGMWTVTNSLNAARNFHTATLLPGGPVLFVGGDGNSGPLSSTEDYDPSLNPATGSWTNTGALSTVRYNHTATLLPNGNVLVAGGAEAGDNDAPLSGAEVYDPTNETWTATGSLTISRSSHTATLLPNGQVLAVGGRGLSGDNPVPLSGAELYTPATGNWVATASLGSSTTARYFHTATLLCDGQVLVAGGQGSGILSSAELFDPARATWTMTGSMNTARYLQTATLLPNGRVLVAGGAASTNPSSAESGVELYDPWNKSWTPTGSLNTARYGHTANLLPNGQVLVAGGYGTSGALSSAELYNPTTGRWTVTGSLHTARSAHTATLLPNGQVLAAGGANNTGFISSTELYNPAIGTWTVSGLLNAARDVHTATLLTDGEVLLAGGYNFGALSRAELFDAGLGFNAGSQPQILSASSPLNVLDGLALTGSQFGGISEGSGGNGSQDSPANYPLVQLRSVESGQTTFISPTNWSATSFASLPISYFPAGFALATVFVNGIPSTSSIVRVPPPPSFQTVSNADGNFTFTWNAVNGFSYQVQYKTNLTSRNWMNLGSSVTATNSTRSASDTIPPGAAARFYRVALLP
jgi:uncharacterized delta-60 repeat protein